MSPTNVQLYASGTCYGIGNNIQCQFTLNDGTQAKFMGAFSPPVPTFQSSSILEYATANDLSGPSSFNQGATVGPTYINLPLTTFTGAQIRISGPLSSPIPQIYVISGSGRWSTSQD